MKELLRRFLSRQQIDYIKHQKLSLKISLLKIFAAHPRLSVLYYLLFSSDFDRECRAVLNGKIQYHQTHQTFELQSSALLRRNTHRLEKGLIMRPRKASFAEMYIGETVTAFKGMLGSPGFCQQEKKWAVDVLTEYFSVVKDTPPIKAAREQFDAIGLSADAAFATNDAQKHIPYPDHARTKSDISTEQLLRLFRQRRSTRWFEKKLVEDNKLNTAIDMASLAPSACNRQPFQFYVMNDNDTANQVASMAAGTTGFASNIPCLIAVVGDMACYPGERDRHLIYIDGSLAAMQLMLALETLELSSCPINWPDIEFRERKIANRLMLNASQRVVMLMAVGYADSAGEIPYSSKKNADTLRVDIKPEGKPS
jgi:nitroreductase